MTTKVYEADIGANWESPHFVFAERVYDTGFRSLQLRSGATGGGFPFIDLNSGQILRMTFDDISAKTAGIEYTLVHCTHDWKRSDLTAMDYMQGFERNNPDDVRFSSVSDIGYVNYEFVLPNDFCKIKLSGNYALVLFRSETPEIPAAILQFTVYEKLVGVKVRVKEPTQVAVSKEKHEIDVEIVHPGLRIDRPNSDLHLAILQNARWDNAIIGLVPRFVKEKSISYDYGDVNNMDGGNEFRHLDLRTLGSTGHSIQRFVPEADDLYHAYVKDDGTRSRLYYDRQDLNGRYAISCTEGFNNRSDSRYVMVHFRLKTGRELSEKVYVSGQFSLYEQRKPFLMTYDSESGEYKTEILMKQGYYNYAYFTQGNESSREFEGSHFNTENEYGVLIYNFDPNGGYDRVIGAAFTDTFNR